MIQNDELLAQRAFSRIRSVRLRARSVKRPEIKTGVVGFDHSLICFSTQRRILSFIPLPLHLNFQFVVNRVEARTANSVGGSYFRKFIAPKPDSFNPSLLTLPAMQTLPMQHEFAGQVSPSLALDKFQLSSCSD